MTKYPPRDRPYDKRCDCGHLRLLHKEGFIDLLVGNIFSGKCGQCMCPRFKDETND